MFDGRWRTTVDKGTGPVGEGLHRTGVTADHLTALGLGMAAVAAVVIGSGHLLWGLVAMGLAAVPDLLDGPVAHAAGTASVRGAFFDSTADRVTDALVLVGIGWFLASSRGGHWSLLAMGVLATSTLISYQRAKAESLGLDAKGGLFERAERILAISVGLAFPVLLLPVLWVLLAGTSLTAVQRFAKVWRQATVAGESPARAPEPAPAPPVAVDVPVADLEREHRSRRFSARDGESAFEARWQAWRAANQADRAGRPRWGERDRVSLGVRWRERRAQAEGSVDRHRRPRSRP